jgi:hypothetical protein
MRGALSSAAHGDFTALKAAEGISSPGRLAPSPPKRQCRPRNLLVNALTTGT